MAGHLANRASRIIQDHANLILKKQKGPKWKRELVPDHKFDYIDVDEFYDLSCYKGFRYICLYIAIIISTLTYVADLWTAGILLIFDRWSLSVDPVISFEISKWIYVVCIALSFILLAWDVYKVRAVLASRDISLGVTNVMAYRYYSVKSYACFCLFRKINASTKKSDICAFFVFYTLKGWKKLFFAQGPRQIIACLTVYSLLRSAWSTRSGSFRVSQNLDDYGENWPQRLALFLMSFTCLIWILSMIELLIACVLYIPVFYQIQGNLKEYCCHKIDKRISEILEKQRRKRIKEQEKRALKNNKKRKEDLPAEPTVPTDKSYRSNLYDETRPLRTAAASPAASHIPVDPRTMPPYTAYSEPAPPVSAPYTPGPPVRAYTQDPHHQPCYPDEPATYFEMQYYHMPATVISTTYSPPPQYHHPSPILSHTAAGPALHNTHYPNHF